MLLFNFVNSPRYLTEYTQGVFVIVVVVHDHDHHHLLLLLLTTEYLLIFPGLLHDGVRKGETSLKGGRPPSFFF